MADTPEQRSPGCDAPCPDPTTPHAWLDGVYDRVARGEGRAANTAVWDTLDGYVLDGNFDAINQVLAAVDVGRLDTVTMLGFLAVTFAANEELPAYAGLAGRVRAQIALTDPSRVDRLMQGFV